jgi:hypothetical protein
LKLPYLASYSLTLSAIEPSLNRDKSCTVRVSASYNEILSLLRPIFAISSSISTLSYISLMSWLSNLKTLVFKLVLYSSSI